MFKMILVAMKKESARHYSKTDWESLVSRFPMKPRMAEML